MYFAGDEEIAALTRVVRDKSLFRYGIGKECATFERRYADYLGAGHFMLSASGSNALAAALMAVGIGPGDEVLVPTHTFMATVTSVLAAGAIPVLVDIDETLTLDPVALEAEIGPRTRAVIPVHMWGTSCDMSAIMAVAERHGLIVVEDACQGVGGSFNGKRFGTIGQAGAFSFNFYKNITAGEGGGVVTSDETIAEKVRCAIDPCNYLWNGKTDFQPFSANGARAGELMGAMLNVQLDRLDGFITAMRAERDELIRTCAGLHNLGLTVPRLNSPGGDCASSLIVSLPTGEAAKRFVEKVRGTVASNTGRHTYTYWEHILAGNGAAHPEMDPYRMAANQACRRTYVREKYQRTMDILDRSVLISMSPLHSRDEIAALKDSIVDAAKYAAL